MKKSDKTNYLIYLLSSIFLIPFTSAGPVQGVAQLTDGARQIINILINFFFNISSDLGFYNEYIFAKILIFALILVATYTVIKDNSIFGDKKNKAIQWIISSAVSILAVRYMPNNFVEAIMLQYSTFGVAISVFLPLIIYFFFIEKSISSPLGRKMGWMVYIVAFFALWSIRYDDLGEANWIYWIAIGVAFLSMVFDKKIHEYFGLSSLRKIKDNMKNENRVRALRRLDLLEADHRKGFYAGRQREYDNLKDELLETIRKNT